MSHLSRNVNGPETGAVSRPLPRRTFVTNDGRGGTDRYRGSGLTLDGVIDRWQRVYRDYWRTFDREVADGRRSGEGDTDPVRYADAWEDLTVWEGRRVVAVLRPHPAGLRTLVVTRFDATGFAPPPTRADRPRTPRVAAPAAGRAGRRKAARVVTP